MIQQQKMSMGMLTNAHTLHQRDPDNVQSAMMYNIAMPNVVYF